MISHEFETSSLTLPSFTSFNVLFRQINQYQWFGLRFSEFDGNKMVLDAVEMEHGAFCAALTHAGTTNEFEVMGLMIGRVSEDHVLPLRFFLMTNASVSLDNRYGIEIDRSDCEEFFTHWIDLYFLSTKNDHVNPFQVTVGWSNFDRLDPKMGVFLQSTKATPCGHVLKWKLTLENPLRTPCSWPPWPWLSREKSLKIFKVS